MWESHNATVLYRGTAKNKSADLNSVEWNLQYRFENRTDLNDYVYNAVINETKWMHIREHIAPYNAWIFFEKFQIHTSPSLRNDMNFDEQIDDNDLVKPLKDVILSISNGVTIWIIQKFDQYVDSLLQQTVGVSIGNSFSSMSNLIRYTFKVAKKYTWNTIKIHLNDGEKIQWDIYKVYILSVFTLDDVYPTIKLTPNDIDKSVHLFIEKMKALCVQFLRLQLKEHIYREMEYVP